MDILSASLSLDGQNALKGGGGDPEPLGNGDVVLHGLGDGMTAHHQHMRTAEQVAPHVDAALMFLWNGVIEEKGLIERRADRRKARLMLDLLASGKPEDLVITKEKALEHTSLIEGNCKMSSFFDFRYNKASETSLEHIWNNANHLITTKYKLSKTEPGNLNFVFADEAILRSFSDYYYITVPAIMSYAVNLICEMFEEFAPLNKYTVLMNKLNRTLRSFEMLETISFDDAKKLYSSGNVPIVCPRCGLKMKMTDKKMLKFISNKCTCSRCLKTIKTGRYIFDWEKVDFVFNE